MSRIRRSLSIDSSLGIPLNYTLQATIPSYMLSKCAAALPRPQWEPILYYSVMCIMAFLLFCIMVASYFEADRHFTADIMKRRARNSLTFDRTKVFDLNQIAAGVRAEVSAQTVTSNGKPAALHRSASTPEAEANGHVQQQQQAPPQPPVEWALSSIFIVRLIKDLFTRWKSYRKHKISSSSNSSPGNSNPGSSRRSPDRPGAAEKETNTHSTTTASHNAKQQTMTDSIKSGMTADGTLVSDNKINPYAVGGKAYKGKKTAKQQQQQQQRQQNDLITDVTAASEKKQGNNKQNSTLSASSAPNLRKLSSDNSEQKDKSATTSTACHRRSTGVDPVHTDATNYATENNATKPNCELLSFPFS